MGRTAAREEDGPGYGDGEFVRGEIEGVWGSLVLNFRSWESEERTRWIVLHAMQKAGELVGQENLYCTKYWPCKYVDRSPMGVGL